MSEKPARAPAEEKEETGKDDDDAGDDPAEDDEEVRPHSEILALGFRV